MGPKGMVGWEAKGSEDFNKVLAQPCQSTFVTQAEPYDTWPPPVREHTRAGDARRKGRMTAGHLSSRIADRLDPCLVDFAEE
jgi:cell wall assembly regulator SMI1